jgi:hypothetical protein
MSTVDSPLVSAGSLQPPVDSSWPGLVPSVRSAARAWQGWAHWSWRCVLAAGVAATVALVPSSGPHGLRVATDAMPKPGSVLRIAVVSRFQGRGHGRVGCLAVRRVPEGDAPSMNPFQRSRGHLQQLAVAWQISADQHGVASAAARLAGGRHAVDVHATACRWQAAAAARLSSQLTRRAHLLFRTLACLEWPPGGSAGSRGGGCTAEPVTRRAHRRYLAFADPGSRVVLASLTAKMEDGAAETWLGQVFPGPPGLAEALIHPSTPDRAAGTPATTCMAGGGSGGQVSSGDRASLPGRSTRYRVIWLVCAHCGVKMACLFYDEGDIPVCANALHGQLEIVR